MAPASDGVHSMLHRYVQDPEHRRTDPPQTSEASTLEKIRGAADSVNDFDGRDAIFMNIFHMHRLVADEVFDWVGDGVSFCNCVVFPVSLV